MASPTASDVLVETLIKWDVDTVFGIPGDGINGIIESLRTHKDKVRFIRGRLRREGRTSFRELFVAGEPRSHWIVTFVALLEMAREGEVRLRQGDRFGEIHVYAEELE